MKTNKPSQNSVRFGLAALAISLGLLLVLPSVPLYSLTGEVVQEVPALPPVEQSLSERVSTQVASQVSQSLEAVVEVPAQVASNEVDSKVPEFDLDAMIGSFPHNKDAKPVPFPHFKLAPQRRSIELYADKKFISEQVYSLALFVGDIDKSMKKKDITKGGFIKGYVYPPHQVIDWLNKEYQNLDKAEKGIAEDLMKLGIVKKDGNTFTWNPQYDGWPINAYSNAGVFRHERVHVLWLQYPQFGPYFMGQWRKDTAGMDKKKKLDYIINSFDNVPYNKPPSRTWWTAVYDQVGENNLVNEFTAHRIEKIQAWKGQVLPIAL